MSRGRKPMQMTHRRRQVLDEIRKAHAEGQKITLARLARRCGLYDYRDARRIVGDLRKMGHKAPVEESQNGRPKKTATIHANRVRCANRRAKSFGADGTLTIEGLSAIMQDQQQLCAICECDLSEGYTIDHIRSLKDGGCNHLENIQLLCSPCNIEKG